MEATCLEDRHRAADARFADAGGRPLLLTYGDVPAEYAAARERAALFDRTDRGLVVATGDDRADFLHRILANDVRRLEPGTGNRNLLLTPKGKVLFAFELEVEDGSIRLETEPGAAAALIDAIEMFHFTEAVEFADATAETAPVALAGPRAAELVEHLAGISPPELGRVVRAEHDGHALRVAARAVAGSPGWSLDAGPAGAGALWDALTAAGARPAGRIAWDSLRVEAAAAEPGFDVDDGIYPQEARWEAAFSLDKGCYIGQEVVAKIDTYGGLNKRLCALRIDHDDPVPTGERLYRIDGDERRDLGVITSWAYSFELDGGLALAYVKRKHQAVGTTFEIGEGRGTASIVAIPVRPDALAVTGEFE